jgi:intracellular sulfur oxidation DsrE/DsrF family protein
MGVNRRNAVAKFFAAALGGAAWSRSANAAESAGVPKVAYHLADTEKVGFVVGNIANHIKGMGGPDKVRIVLVVHGPALALFQTRKTNVAIERQVAGFAANKVGFVACGNTMEAQKIGLADLLPGFERADEGGVVRLAKLQAEGYAYLRP